MILSCSEELGELSEAISRGRGARTCGEKYNGTGGGRRGREFYLRRGRSGAAQARLRGRPPLAPFERAAAALAGEVAWPARRASSRVIQARVPKTPDTSAGT